MFFSFFHLFSPIFTLNSAVFVGGGAKIFLPNATAKGWRRGQYPPNFNLKETLGFTVAFPAFTMQIEKFAPHKYFLAMLLG